MKSRRDLLRDPRCSLHSAVRDPEGSEGELKLSGRAEVVDDPLGRKSDRRGSIMRMPEAGQPLERELEEIGAQLAWVRDYL